MSRRRMVLSQLALKGRFCPSPKRMVARAMVLALVVAGFTVLGTGQALASRVGCGDTITTDTTLTSDLVDCPNNGIVIGADHITLDLNGHTIDGDATLVDPCPEGESCDVGVDNSAGHKGVTVEDGSVRDFALGVFILGASNNSLRHLSVSRSFFSGIVIGESARSRVERSSISRNGLTTDQAGMVLFASHDNRIERNRLSGNGDIGLFAVDSANGNRIEMNTVSEHPEAGMVIEGDSNQVSRNRVLRNGDGIVISGNDNAITQNQVADALGCPEDGEIGCGFGISFEGG